MSELDRDGGQGSVVGIVTGGQGSVVGIVTSGQGSVVGIVTRYVLDGPRIECWWGKILHAIQNSPKAHPASFTTGTGSPGGRVAAACC